MTDGRRRTTTTTEDDDDTRRRTTMTDNDDGRRRRRKNLVGFFCQKLGIFFKAEQNVIFLKKSSERRTTMTDDDDGKISLAFFAKNLEFFLKLSKT